MTKHRHAVAIVGMAGRFPGAPNLEAFWRQLRDGIESFETFSDDDLRAAGVPPAVAAQSHYVRRGTVLEDADRFDAGFFGLSPREAETIDPQHRLFLECAWEAIEDAGYPPLHVPGSVGVFAGCSMNTYLPSVLARNPEAMAAAGGYQLMLGNDKDFLTTRVSYKLNLRGPSVAIQTACSTSLVAVQAAYQSLIKQQCDVALAGGASVTFPQRAGYLYQEGMIFSPDGHCRPFDANGKGIRSGAGVGIVMLKRLEDALADGDPIRAVIRGAAINNDGSNKVGYTAPSVEGQADVIATAQALAQVDPATIGYVEAHGTGTPLGDPIEVAALTRAFRARTDRRGYCALGSLKSNLGHLDAAAGVAGLIKTVLSLEHQALPPSLNFVTPNPAIDFDDSPFYVNTALTPWPAGAEPRRAGVSSFGIGGTNAHVVLEEAPVRPSTDPADGPHLLVLSARSRPALETATAALADHLAARPDLDLADVAYTLQLGREPFPHRRVIVAASVSEALQAIASRDPERVVGGEAGARRPVVFMFSGQGSQHRDMARGLYQREAAFRRAFDACADRFVPHLGLDLRDAVFPDPAHAQGPTADLDQTSLTQPALFAVEYALASMWMARGVEPEAMIGHSIGEYAAACLAGVFTLDEATRLVALRGRLMQSMPPGAMLSVFLPEEEVRPLLESAVTVAAVNAPGMSTVAGPADAIGRLAATLTARGVEHRALQTSHAFHSAMMDPILAPFEAAVRECTLAAPARPFISNLTGTWITAEEATDPRYWVKHLRQPVLFGPGLNTLAANPERIYLEVGPGTVLGTFARQTVGRAGRPAVVIASLPHPKHAAAADRHALTALARLWIAGASVDWHQVHGSARRGRVRLPTYPFERQRYWVDPAGSSVAGAPSALDKRPDVDDWFAAPTWTRSAAVDGAAPEPAVGPWLLFVDDTGIGAAMAASLVRHDRFVTRVEVGADYQEVGPDHFRIDPGNPDHYHRLLTTLESSERSPTRIVHLWTVGAPSVGDDRLAAADRARTRGLHSLLFLAQATGNHPSQRTTSWIVVSSGVHAVVDPAEATDPEKAILTGICQVIPLEYQGVACRVVDLELPVEPAGVAAAAERLVREATVDRSASTIAYRAGRRWELTYEAVTLRRRPPAALARREGGVYLITGGTGGLGLVFAASLASAGGTLVLTSRSGLPDRKDWDRLTAADPTGRQAVTLAAIRELEKKGTTVEVVATDAGNPDAVRALVTELRRRLGVIHGVIHAAGVPGGGMLQLRTRAQIDEVLAPKVTGTLALHEALQGNPLDFFVLCSSINAILTGPGGADYCAANAFLDAYAHHRHGRGDRSVVSINWDTWRDVGMAVNAIVPADREAAKAASLATGILAEEGVAALGRIVGAELPQVVVSTRDLQLLRYLDTLGRIARGATTGGQGPSGSLPSSATSRHQRPDLGTEFVQPASDDERRVASIWEELLGIDGVGVNDNFFELGGHSLLATQVLVRIRDAFGVTIPLEAVFDAPTVGQLADRIGTLRWIVESSQPSTREEPDGHREEFEI
ncbi:MAG: SDR family NAD(P)-dependent oxidoreductase [Gemmatimonadetes bacterium]|nr:SDR family NAD(P)-dependent oxidoreductase [Gemmatimonadota bacterium]